MVGMEPLIPRVGATEVLGPSKDKVDRLMDDAHGFMEAKKSATVLQSLGIGGGRSSDAISEGMGSALSGLGDLIGGLSKSQGELLQLALGQAKGGGTDSGLVTALLAMVLRQPQEGGTESTVMAFLKDTITELRAEVRELRTEQRQRLEEQTAPGPFDSAAFPVLNQMAGAMVQRLVNPPDPIEEAEQLMKRVQKLSGNPNTGGLFGNGMSAAERMQSQELYYGHMDRVARHDLERERLAAQQQRPGQVMEMVDHIGAAVGNALEVAAGKLGLGPVRPVDPQVRQQAQAEAQAAMERARAGDTAGAVA